MRNFPFLTYCKTAHSSVSLLYSDEIKNNQMCNVCLHVRHYPLCAEPRVYHTMLTGLCGLSLCKLKVILYAGITHAQETKHMSSKFTVKIVCILAWDQNFQFLDYLWYFRCCHRAKFDTCQIEWVNTQLFANGAAHLLLLVTGQSEIIWEILWVFYKAC